MDMLLHYIDLFLSSASYNQETKRFNTSNKKISSDGSSITISTKIKSYQMCFSTDIDVLDYPDSVHIYNGEIRSIGVSGENIKNKHVEIQYNNEDEKTFNLNVREIDFNNQEESFTVSLLYSSVDLLCIQMYNEGYARFKFLFEKYPYLTSIFYNAGNDELIIAEIKRTLGITDETTVPNIK